MPNTDVSERETSARRWSPLALLSLGLVIAYIDRVNLSVALSWPAFVRHFSLSDTERGLLNSALFWSYAVCQVPAGWVVDRYGIRRTYAGGFLLWSVAAAATAAAGSVAHLVALRLALGVSESVIIPASMSWIRAHFPESGRGLALGLFFAGSKVGPAVGAVLATTLVTLYGWRAMFAILGLGSLLWLIPWLALTRDAPRAPAAPRPAGAIAERPGLLGLLRTPVILGVSLGGFAVSYCLYFCMTWMPAYFVEQRGLPLASMGWYTMFSFGGMAVTAALGGYAGDRLVAAGWDAVRVRKGLAIAGLLLASTELLGALSESRSVAVFFALFSMAGLGVATANVWAVTQALVDGRAIGRVAGIQNCVSNVAGIAAPIVTGWLKQATGGYVAPMAVMFLVLLGGVAAYVWLAKAERAVPPKPGLPAGVSVGIS